MEVLTFPSPESHDSARDYHQFLLQYGLQSKGITKLLPLHIAPESRHAVSVIEREYQDSGKYAFVIYRETTDTFLKPAIQKPLIDNSIFNCEVVGLLFNDSSNPEQLQELYGALNTSLQHYQSAA